MINNQRLIKLTQKVLSINSENPPGKELEIARFVEKDMRSLGIEVKTYAFEKGRPNIVATIKGSLPRKQAARGAILITPHIDTVPIGKGWKYDPYGSDIKGGKLYGRGTSDDKGNLASCMEVMRSLVEDKLRLRKDVVMAATVDEECGSHCGIIPLLDKKVLKPALAVVMDSSEFDAIIVQKGLFHGKIQIFGKKAHGAYNWRGINAIEIAARVIRNLKSFQYPYERHPLLHGPTMNIGVIQGGDKVNMVPDFCEVFFDARFLPGTNPKYLLRLIQSSIEKETKRYRLQILDLQAPYEMDRHHPFVKTYLKVCRKMKCPAEPKGCEGATVITFFQKHGIPAFATGFAAHDTAHTNDEYIYIKSLCKGTRALEAYIKEYDKL